MCSVYNGTFLLHDTMCVDEQQLWIALYQSWQRYLPTYNAISQEINNIKQHDNDLKVHVVKLRKYVLLSIIRYLLSIIHNKIFNSKGSAISSSLYKYIYIYIYTMPMSWILTQKFVSQRVKTRLRTRGSALRASLFNELGIAHSVHPMSVAGFGNTRETVGFLRREFSNPMM